MFWKKFIKSKVKGAPGKADSDDERDDSDDASEDDESPPKGKKAKKEKKPKKEKPKKTKKPKKAKAPKPAKKARGKKPVAAPVPDFDDAFLDEDATVFAAIKTEPEVIPLKKALVMITACIIFTVVSIGTGVFFGVNFAKTKIAETQELSAKAAEASQRLELRTVGEGSLLRLPAAGPSPGEYPNKAWNSRKVRDFLGLPEKTEGQEQTDMTKVSETSSSTPTSSSTISTTSASQDTSTAPSTASSTPPSS